jgi:hypothetical protein
MQTSYLDLLFFMSAPDQADPLTKRRFVCISCRRFTRVPPNIVPAAKRNTKTTGEQHE